MGLNQALSGTTRFISRFIQPSIVKEVLYFQRGQENVRNRTQVKLAATSLECKQAGRFSIALTVNLISYKTKGES